MKNRNGFMLFEVMLAMAVLTGGIVLIFSSFRYSLRAFGLSQERFQAGLLMESKMWALERNPEKFPVYTEEETGLGSVVWEMQAHEEKDRDLQRFDLNMTWGKRKNELDLSVYKFQE